MRRVPFTLLLTATCAWGQSAPEHHAWQNAGAFEPVSRTAVAITGTITLSGDPEFASPGSEMTMRFENGKLVNLTSVEASWRRWSLTDNESYTAEVFRLDEDPGELLNGNSLCGGDQADHPLFAVFVENRLLGLPPSLGMAIFSSAAPPYDIYSPGLCGTFYYMIPEVTHAETALDAPGDRSVPSHWSLTRSTNPIDDTATVVLSLHATEGASSLGEPVTFVARCKSNKTEAYAVWGDYLGDDSPGGTSEWKNVIVRIGSEAAKTERWGVSTDRTATFVPDWAGNLLKDLLNHERLVLQTIPHGENPITAVFDVSGLRDVLGELAEACDWSF